MRAAIEKLPEKERKLLQGYYFQGKTLEEAGAEIGQSKSWASRLHARAIERLKELLNEEEAPSPDGCKEAHMAGPMAGDLGSTDRSAEAAGSGRQQVNKQGASKFDGALADKAQGVRPGGAGPGQSTRPQAAQKVDVVRQVEHVDKTEKAEPEQGERQRRASSRSRPPSR